MLWLKSKLQYYIDIYKKPLMDEIKNIPYRTPEEQTDHVNRLTTANRGNDGSKQWLLSTIKTVLSKIVKGSDMERINEIILKEYDIFLNKKYEVFDDDSEYIGYYQLLDSYMNEADKKNLYNRNLDDLRDNEEFTELMYSVTYGTDLLEPLLKIKLNNIEVHGTRKIRVELPDGHWKTIYDYRFLRDEEITNVADHVLNMNIKSPEDLTEENCMAEGQTYDGKRISVALKPASRHNMIFIKNYNASNIKTMEDLVKCGEVTEEMYEELKVYAKGRANIVFIGGVNAGKSTLMDAYAGLIPKDKYKFGIAEDDFDSKFAELYPDSDFVNLRATSKYSINDQFVRMLRMNRDILCIPEVRSYEVLQLINAMTRGAAGSYSNMHVINPYDLINTMAWMALESGIPMDLKLLIQRISSAIDIVVRVWQDVYGRTRIADRIDEIKKDRYNLDIPYHINTIYERNIKTGAVEKVGNISKELRDKFMYYGCTREDIDRIVRKDLDNNECN